MWNQILYVDVCSTQIKGSASKVVYETDVWFVSFLSLFIQQTADILKEKMNIIKELNTHLEMIHESYQDERRLPSSQMRAPFAQH